MHNLREKNGIPHVQLHVVVSHLIRGFVEHKIIRTPSKRVPFGLILIKCKLYSTLSLLSNGNMTKGCKTLKIIAWRQLHLPIHFIALHFIVTAINESAL